VKSSDDCERANARLSRIDKSRGQPMSNATADRLTATCRTSKHASDDPVLRCAMESATDDAAAECIERGISDVVVPSSSGSARDGSGINPLLQD
jgi:hypothetical protein